jgi:hypothetical protein
MLMVDEQRTHHHSFGRHSHEADAREAIDFIDIDGKLSVLDIGGGDGVYSKEFVRRGFEVTLLDAHDYNFSELNSMGIKTIRGDFCNYSGHGYDILFMAHVYHDLIHDCRERVSTNIKAIGGRYVAIIDFTKEGIQFGPPKWLRIDKEDVIRDMNSIGYILVRSKDIQNQYILLFEKMPDSQ